METMRIEDALEQERARVECLTRENAALAKQNRSLRGAMFAACWLFLLIGAAICYLPSGC